jgi:hypothetical protein
VFEAPHRLGADWFLDELVTLSVGYVLASSER